MKGAQICSKGQIRVDGKCYPGIKTKHWTIVESVSDLQIYRGEPNFNNWRGTLTAGESDWQPPSIQISQDQMKHMEESNVAIFFDEKDLKSRKWENLDLP